MINKGMKCPLSQITIPCHNHHMINKDSDYSINKDEQYNVGAQNKHGHHECTTNAHGCMCVCTCTCGHLHTLPK